MAGKSWAQVKEVFHEALRRDTGERERFLEEACAGDISFRIEVESLLISLAEAESFLEQPVVGEIKTPSAWRLPNGTEISHYKIVEPIGVGGMGEVYLADDLRLNRQVALKILPEQMLADRDRLRRFQREADVVSALNHPNILTIFEFGTEGDVHLFASEYVKGETLRDRLKRGRMSISESLDIAVQVTSALIAAHEAGVVHRDVKPENIMIRNDGYVKVLDFGLAKQTESNRASEFAATRALLVSQPGLIMGTVAYMSPEQVRARSVDARTDIFSLGVVLYEMLTGASPFTGETTTDVIAATLQIEPPPVSQINKRASAEIDSIVSHALKKDRLERYQTAEEMAADLKALLKRVSFEEEFGKQSLKVPSTRTTALMPLVEPFPSVLRSQKRPGNLSDSGSPMIGREKEAADIFDLLRRGDVRLVTLTGIGGTGKTRLAQEVGRRMKQHFPDGVFFVELAAVTDPVLVIPTIAHTLEIPEAGPRVIAEALAEHLQDGSTLLILDNLEQIVAAGLEITQLLRAVAALKIIVTSREPLKLTVETEYPVPPLELPQPDENISVEELGQFEAVKLFVHCASRARADFALTVDNAAAVSEICRRLDGIPLAIELAAARTKILSTQAILEKLENRLDVLTGGSKDLPARQQTMRGAIEWSYDLLSDDEREMFRRLSVFAGGFSYGTAEAVLAKTGKNSTAGFLDLVTSLTEKGLVIPQKHSSETPRFRMLDVVRAYALERLCSGDEAESVHLAHAEYYLELGQQAEPKLKTVESAKWILRLEQEHDNLRAAIHWSVENRPEIAARIAAAIRSLWTVHGHLNEGSRLASKILSSGAEMTDEVRWKILTANGNMSQFRGILDKAQELYDESLVVARGSGDQAQISQSLRGLGAVAYMRDDFRSARQFISEALEISRADDDQFGIAASLGRLGDIAYCDGNYQESFTYSQDALEIFRNLGYQEGICSKLSTLGAAAFALGDIDVARTSFEEGFKIALSLDEKINIRHIMSGFAGLATQSGDFLRAARLDGVAEGLGASVEYAIEPAECQFRDAYLAKLKPALSKSLFDKEFAIGRAMSINDAKKLVLDESGLGTGTTKQEIAPLTSQVDTRKERPFRIDKKKALIILAALLLLFAVSGFAYWMFFAHASNSQIRSIAVFPFQNRSAETEDADYLSDGLAESLIYRLSQLPDLKVSPTSTVFRYAGSEIDPAKAGEELGVDAVLSGRIVQRGDTVTISVDLVDVRNQSLIWGEQYDRRMTDLLATQREIAQEVVDKLKLKVSNDEKGIEKHYTENNDAYRLYLKGRFYWNKRSSDGINKSIEYFNQAIEKDPGFALAYAGLADAYIVPANPLPPREKMPKGKVAALRAVELDESLVEAHTSLARVYMAYDWNWAGAEKEFRRAIELNPDYAPAHEWYGGYLEAMGRHDEAIAERKLALELDPLSLIINFEMGLAFYYARDYDHAIEHFKKTLELDPTFQPAQQFLPAAYEQKRMFAESIAGFSEAIPMDIGDGSISAAGLGHVYAISGRRNKAKALIDKLKMLYKQQYIPGAAIAMIYTGLGEKDQAFIWLEKSYEDRSFRMVTLKIEPRWDTLRSDPRFADLMRRVGLPQ